MEHKLDRAVTLSRELERNDGYQPLLSLNSTGRPLKTADESILTDGEAFVETIKVVLARGRLLGAGVASHVVR